MCRPLVLLCFSCCAVCLVASEADEILLTRGATEIAFTMPYDGKASLGLYTPEGQLKRILFQAIDLKAGEHVARWDGLDLWGKLMPVGTQLQAKIFMHPGIKAFYEFPLGHGDWHKGDPPWRTAVTFPDRKVEPGTVDKRSYSSRKTGVIQPGERTLRGGWMADHGTPRAIEVVGEKVFISASGAEAGDGFIATDLQGRKLWGYALAMGTGGPEKMWALNDTEMFTLKKGALKRVDATTFTSKPFKNLGRGVQSIDIAGGQVHVLYKPSSARKVNRFPLTLDKGGIKYIETRPLHMNDKAEDLSQRSRFFGVFNRGSHFMVGVKPAYQGPYAYILCPFTKFAEVGTALVAPYAEKTYNMEIFTLKEGLTYTVQEHSPLSVDRQRPDASSAADGIVDVDAADDDDLFDDIGTDADVFSFDITEHWELFGSTTGTEPLTVLTSPDGVRKTGAVLLRFHLPSGKKKQKTGIDLIRCDLLSKCVRGPAQLPSIAVDPVVLTKAAPKQAQGWHLRAKHKVEPGRPLTMLLDYKKEFSFDGFSLLAPRNHEFYVDVYRGSGTPDVNKEQDWEEVFRFNVGPSRRTGYGTQKDNLHRYESIAKRETTRALRIRYHSGLGRGMKRMGWEKGDPNLVSIASFLPLCVDGEAPTDGAKGPAYPYVVYDAETGEELRKMDTYQARFERFVLGERGEGYAVLKADGSLVRTTLQGDTWVHEPIEVDHAPPSYNSIRFTGGYLLAAGLDRILMIDPGTLQTKHVLGQKGIYKPGPFSRHQVGKKVRDMSIDKHGKIWFVESRRQPKRVARFNKHGECEWNMTGGPRYGGGGYIDPDFNDFYYNAMRYSLDYDKGESHLIGFADQPYWQTSPISTTSTFSYTSAGRVVKHANGHKYAVGKNGEVVCLLKDGVWHPCLVIGWCQEGRNPFFTKKAWKQHWVGKKMDGQFLWNDRNGDGDFQVEEVDIFSVSKHDGQPSIHKGAYWGTLIGEDLAINTNAGRLAPYEFTSSGIPLYRKEDLQVSDYKEMRTFTKTQTWGQRAKPNPSRYRGESIVSSRGHKVYMAQPYVWDQSLQPIGGAPDTEGGGDGFQPEVPGAKIEYPLGYAGVGHTTGDAGEVAVIIGNGGTWTIESVHDRIVLQNIFDGTDGDFSTDLPGTRGTEVTHRSFESEAFFGNFVATPDKRHFVTAGKNYHALIRLDGLNGVKMVEVPVQVSAEEQAENVELRDILVQEWKAFLAARNKPRQLYVQTTRERLGKEKPAVDGHIARWGGIKRMQPIDIKYRVSDPEQRMYFDMARSKAGLHLVFAGRNYQGSSTQEVAGIFKEGFAFDFRWRNSGDKKKTKEVQIGDRRIVFGKIQGVWSAVLFDYRLPPDVDTDQAMKFSSPVVTTEVEKVVRLDPSRYQLVVHEDAMLMGDLLDVEVGTADILKRQSAVVAEDKRPWWTAEVFLPWSLVGSLGSYGFIGDVGVLGADSGGRRVAERRYWATPHVLHTVADLGAEAAIDPQRWGLFSFKPLDDL